MGNGLALKSVSKQVRLIQQLRNFRADLHIHTVLSPCADVEMIPPLIVESALDHGIQLIAITDHNSSANFAAVQNAAKNTSLQVFPGMELQTREEVHTLCLFDSIDQLNQFQKIVDQSMPNLQNDPEHFGEQFVVDETGDFIRREDRLLISSSSLSLKDAWQHVSRLGGIFIPAHVNRKAFGLLENLGFMPTDIKVDAVEVSRHVGVVEASQKFPQLKGYPIIQNGDVHRLDEFLGSMWLEIAEATVTEIKKALQRIDGRNYTISTEA